jgi:hypothetical protein
VSDGKNIREILGHLIGQRLLEITQEDEEDREAGRGGFIQFGFEDGNTVTLYIAQDNLAYKEGYPLSFSDPTDKGSE